MLVKAKLDVVVPQCGKQGCIDKGVLGGAIAPQKCPVKHPQNHLIAPPNFKSCLQPWKRMVRLNYIYLCSSQADKKSDDSGVLHMP